MLFVSLVFDGFFFPGDPALTREEFPVAASEKVLIMFAFLSCW